MAVAECRLWALDQLAVMLPEEFWGVRETCNKTEPKSSRTGVLTRDDLGSVCSTGVLTRDCYASGCFFTARLPYTHQ